MTDAPRAPRYRPACRMPKPPRGAPPRETTPPPDPDREWREAHPLGPTLPSGGKRRPYKPSPRQRPAVPERTGDRGSVMLWEAVRDRGLTLADLAEMIGVSVKSLRDQVLGQERLSARTALRLQVMAGLPGYAGYVEQAREDLRLAALEEGLDVPDATP